MSVYTGSRTSNGIGHQVVRRNGTVLPSEPSKGIRNHSPDGFQWGYSGSGSAQLALALLYDVTGDKRLSLKHHQNFKRAFVAKWSDNWSITAKEIANWLHNEERLLTTCQILET